MTPTLFSLIAVTFGFLVLVIWAFWPGNRDRLEAHGRIPLEDSSDVGNIGSNQTVEPAEDSAEVTSRE